MPENGGDHGFAFLGNDDEFLFESVYITSYSNDCLGPAGDLKVSALFSLISVSLCFDFTPQPSLSFSYTVPGVRDAVPFEGISAFFHLDPGKDSENQHKRWAFFIVFC